MQLSEAISIYVDVLSRQEEDLRPAFEAIEQFCESNHELSDDVARQMISILGQRDDAWLPQLAVSQIVLRYKKLDQAFMEPLLWAAIEIQNPSCNKDFLTPCLTSFGSVAVVDRLTDTFADADMVQRIGISSLVYWLDSYPVDVLELRRRKKDGLEVDVWLANHAIDASPLKKVISDASRMTDHLVELYFYRQALPESPELFPGVPDHAIALCEMIKGHAAYEELLYNQLGWQRPKM